MFKPVAASVLVHIVVLALVWVGFPVPLPRNGVEFYYTGSFMPEEIPAARRAVKEKVHHEAVAIKAVEAGSFDPWIQMRNFDKPQRP